MENVQDFCDEFECEPTLIQYGSRVYGTHGVQSDYDYLAIVPDVAKVQTGYEYRKNLTNIHVFSTTDFKQQLEEHKIHTLEALFLPNSPIWGKHPFCFTLSLPKLRSELAAKASNSFVKAKKKIQKEKDYYIGWKSLFHSLRILCFGIQIAKVGRITDFSVANHYWFDILNAQQYVWEYFKEKYQPEYNKLATEFRQLAPVQATLDELQKKHNKWTSEGKLSPHDD